MTSNKLISFRTAISLNNMGVCIMKHGHFDAAMETFKDALFIMKNILNQSSSPAAATSSLDSNSSNVSVQEEEKNKLEAARMRLAQSQAQPILNDYLNIQPCDDGNVTAMKVPIIEIQQHHHLHNGPPSSQSSSSSSSSCSTTVFIPIRLDSCNHHQLAVPNFLEENNYGGSDHHCNYNEQEQQVEQQHLLEHFFKIPSSIILYNYGLSHILTHLQNSNNNKTSPNGSIVTATSTTSGTTTTTPADETSEQESSSSSLLLHGGFVCFTMAHAILCQERGAACAAFAAAGGGGGMLQQEHIEHQQNAVSFEILQAMLISGLVLRNLLFIFEINHQIPAAQNVLHTLSSLMYIIQIHEDVLRNMNVELENYKTACAA